MIPIVITIRIKKICINDTEYQISSITIDQTIFHSLNTRKFGKNHFTFIIQNYAYIAYDDLIKFPSVFTPQRRKTTVSLFIFPRICNQN